MTHIMDRVFGNPTADIFKHTESISVSPEGRDGSAHESDRFAPKKLPSLIAFVLTLFLPIGSLAATTNTQVVAWGAGTINDPSDGHDYGQSIVPANLTNAVEVAGGQLDSLVLKADGTLAAWGDDSYGETEVPPGSNYVAIACGAAHNLALQSDGVVVAFGEDLYGQTDVPAGLSNVVAVACGFYHSVALQADGTVVAWGADTNMEPVGRNPNYGQTWWPLPPADIIAWRWKPTARWSSGAIKPVGAVTFRRDFPTWWPLRLGLNTMLP
jgi:hypothetical protein